MLGLDAKICRLLAYMEVQSMAAGGVQSGYHKCWNAMLTSTAPQHVNLVVVGLVASIY